MIEINYPGVFDRVKAIIIDGIVIVVFMFVAAYIFSLFESVPDKARISAFVFIFILYDPIFTSFFGGTIGHMVIGIRVRRVSDEQKKIPFYLAIPRYAVKALLGWVSLILVSGNTKRMAVHDYLVGSIVVYSNAKDS